ncbi:hypothetical protein [Bradyrhizobium australafricanum]|uniref:hypothetical protein n=1 Tax=Bradyrhizobium australafricanum TaxID=2821406 RepID=UPI001CE2AEC9|nr:hypothetical protein [Bradyrhizobium australafricanum]MCA6100509.1 hypothetical protein [Bradyrhizobium australafricanum]
MIGIVCEFVRVSLRLAACRMRRQNHWLQSDIFLTEEEVFDLQNATQMLGVVDTQANPAAM